MRALRYVWLLTLSLTLTAVADRVGDSLSLEGRAAVIRAAMWLRERQLADGSWENDAALTAIAGNAMVASDSLCGSDALEESLGRAVAYLRRIVPTCHGMAAAQAVRLFMRLGSRDDQAQVERVREELKRLKEVPGAELPWVLDCTRTVPLKASMAGCSAAVQLAVSLATNAYTDSSLKIQLSAVRHSDWRSLPMADIYWSARSLQAVCAAAVMPYDGWKSDVLVALLERQRGNGAWSDSVRDTALAIKVVLLCLAD